MMRIAFLLILCCLTALTFAQSPSERAIAINTEWISADSLQLSWPQSQSADSIFSIFKSDPFQTSAPTLIRQQSDTSFIDVLAKGEVAEYFVYQSDPFPFRDTFMVDSSFYEISLQDEFGKGLCCNFGNGYFQLTNAEGEKIFLANDFGFDTTWVFESKIADTLYLEIQSDLFGDHLQYSIRDTIQDSLLTSFGPFGNYRELVPTYGTLWVSNDFIHSLNMGTVLVLCADNLIDSLTNELNLLESDLKKLGYDVILKSLSTDLPDAVVRDSMREWFSGIDESKTVYILGHIAVPYSGDIYPDTHSENHKGAWSADGFYGVAADLWTDTLVNETSAFFDRNKNIPNDGKWDQSTFPGTVDYKIGRVDLSNLSAFEKNEIELTRDYLNKAQAWRRGELITNYRGLVDDNFDDQFGAPAANGYRNLWNLLGKPAVQDSDFTTELTQGSYLWVYSCGSGSHVSSEGVSTTAEMAEDSLQGIFLMSFGSQFGDWDNSNNFLRAPLASGTVLSNAWVGNPHIDFREMGLGFPIGQSIQRNMNQPSALHEKGPVMVHLGLLGDPTITQYPIAAAKDLSLLVQTNTIQLAWSASPANYSMAYEIYRSDSTGVDWQFLDTTADLNYIDEDPLVGINQYNLFALAHIENNGGRFFKRSMPINALDTFIVINSINSLQESNNWTIFPNPAQSSLAISRAGFLSNFSSGHLINVLGQVVAAPIRHSGEGIHIDVSGLAAGVYYYRVAGLVSPAIIVK